MNKIQIDKILAAFSAANWQYPSCCYAHLTTPEQAQIDDDDNRRGEPTEGLIPEGGIFFIPPNDDYVFDEAPEWWTLGGILES